KYTSRGATQNRHGGRGLTAWNTRWYTRIGEMPRYPCPAIGVPADGGPEMRALIKPSAAPGLVMTTRPQPVLGPSDILVRVLQTGICGTDLHIDAWDSWAQSTVKTPLVPGHEFVGEV